MPEIDRGQLRGLFIDSLADGTIRWGHGVEDVAGRSVRFGDGSSEEFDLVVGADGAWSRVRPSVSEARPACTGVTFVETGFEEPVGHSWTHTPGVTLLGDAAHLMPPLGVGANLAMLDGAEPADALAAALTTGPDVDAAVRAYESVMFPRAARWARFTVDGLEALFSPEGVKGALRLFDGLNR
ncbi:FAD-dependent oxidoreductase [Nonomuraea sp. NPDC050153]|uniref:FAD-dependent oxidoreductase n=1 Tax=Nonomuraea sp. NPDC050153 TaxID=3364359 RepID=UPI0037AE39A3